MSDPWISFSKGLTGNIRSVILQAAFLPELYNVVLELGDDEEYKLVRSATGCSHSNCLDRLPDRTDEFVGATSKIKTVPRVLN